MRHEAVEIPVTPADPATARAARHVTGALARPSRPDSGIAFVFAHGAGGDMNAKLLVAVADGLTERGHTTLRFNFLYKDAGRSAPDTAAVLERTWQAVAEWMRPRAARLVLGGKSMGGRYASIIASKGVACDSLVFLGYPLHAAGKPESLRDKHLAAVKSPMLFIQGTRDPLCKLDLLRPVIARLGDRARLHVIEGGDHSLAVLKSTGQSFDDVVREAVEAADSFVRRA